MSGGVDSSVAALMLRNEGYEVEGLSLLLFETRGKPSPTSCCSLQAVSDAASTAKKLGISHSTLNARDEFIRNVMEPFVQAYLQGLTPNPCILCNRHVKFPMLLQEARRRGAEFIATGHYARVHRTDRKVLLKKGLDPGKDQSYVLYALRGEELRCLLLPIGGQSKNDTRRIAAESDLPVLGRPESQEICFVEDRDYTFFIDVLTEDASDTLGPIGRPGPIVGPDGRMLGRHKGIHYYTVGQRKGLGVYSPEPLYVTRIDRTENSVHVGSREDASRREIEVDDLNWLVPSYEVTFRADVKVRSMMQAAPASIIRTADDTVRVAFDKPQFAPSPGQAAVFYDGETVLGGGTIKANPLLK